MRSSLDYAGFAQLCARSPIMHKIMRAHDRIIQRSLGKTSLSLNEARDDGALGWQWHQLDHTQTICTSLQTDNHASTPPLCFLQSGCPSCCLTCSVKALKAVVIAVVIILTVRSKEVLMTVLNSNSTFFWTTDYKQNVISFIYNRFTEVSVINRSCYLFHAFSSKMVCFTTLVTVEY